MKEIMQKPWLTELERKLAERTEQQQWWFDRGSKFIRREWDKEFTSLVAQKCHGVTTRY